MKYFIFACCLNSFYYRNTEFYNHQLLSSIVLITSKYFWHLKTTTRTYSPCLLWCVCKYARAYLVGVVFFYRDKAKAVERVSSI